MQKLRPLNLQKNPDSKFKRVKKITRRLLPFLFAAGFLMVIAFFLSTFSGSSSVVTQILSGTSLKSSGGRINVLLLGIAGGKHDGADLTDTIMVASYDLKKNQATLISIPRDLWMPSLQSKANAVYQMGILQKNGLGFSKTVMGNIVGLPIHYGLRIDFRGFENAVDALGGLEIMVERDFDDFNYPIEEKENDLCGWEEKEMEFSEEAAKALNIEAGKRKVFVDPAGKIATDSAQEDMGAKYFSCRYEHLRFDKGPGVLNGKEALKFVRSRHGTNGENSDFSRSKRQQKVLEALKEKLLSFETLSSPSTLTELFNAAGASIDMDISTRDAVEFYKLSRKISSMQTFVLDDSPKIGLPDNRTSLLYHPPRGSYGGAYVLVSLDDDFSLVSGYVRKILTGEITEYDATASARAR